MVSRNSQLASLLNYCLKNNRFWRDRIPPQALAGDFHLIPVLGQEAIAASTTPYTHLLSTAIRPDYVFSSGGTTGRPKLTFLTRNELELNCKYHGLGYQSAGISPDDVVATFGAGGYLTSEVMVHRALAHTDCFVIPIGCHNDPKVVVDYLQLFSVTALLVMPSDLIPLANYILSTGTAVRVSRLVYGGERLDPSIRSILSQAFNFESIRGVYQTMDAGTIGFQCVHCDDDDYHIHEELQFSEVVDKDGRPVKPGTPGELVTTNLSRRLMPVIRYATGDRARIIPQPCRCGNPATLIRFLGRSSEHVSIGGEKIDPAAVSAAIASFPGLSGAFQLIIDRENHIDRMTIKLETLPAYPQPEAEDIAASVLSRCRNLFHSLEFGSVRPIRIEFAAPDTIERIKATGKIKRVVDLRPTGGSYDTVS